MFSSEARIIHRTEMMNTTLREEILRTQSVIILPYIQIIDHQFRGKYKSFYTNKHIHSITYITILIRKLEAQNVPIKYIKYKNVQI